MRLRRTRLLTGVLALACLGAAVTPAVSRPDAAAAAAPRGHARAVSDFNGDGYADLAVGSPNASGGLGAVTVLFGSPSGLTTAGSEYWTLGSVGVAGPRPAPGDQFGWTIAAGDFNGDGYSDLAIGVPGRSGAVILYGSRMGLQAAGSQFVQGKGTLAGRTLAAGDFNNDGFADLAVGAPFAVVAGVAGAGSVEVHYGSAAGLGALARGTAQRFSEATSGIPGAGALGTNDEFGLALAAGDFNGDGTDDLAIGAPNTNYGTGAATVLYGSSSGLTVHGGQFVPVFGNSGGYALAAADFNGDGVDDLAIGAPNYGTAGLIEVHYGSAAGLTKIAPGTAKVFTQASLGMPGPPEAAYDYFGASLAAGDFNGDGYADVAIGVPGKAAAIALYGSAHGLTTHGSQFVAGVGPQGGSILGTSVVSVAAADFDRDRDDDLVVGEPFAAAPQAASGVVEVHPGSPNRLTNTAAGTALTFSESTAGMAGPPPGSEDFFGLSLAARGQSQ